MTLTVHSLSGSTNYVPYYPYMQVGQFLSQIVAPALGCAVNSETGDVVHNRFILNGRTVFCKENKSKMVSDVLQDGAILYHTLNMGRSDKCLVGNGCLKRPTVHQLTLMPSVASGAEVPSACKKRKA
jgi:hypothetical protein